MGSSSLGEIMSTQELKAIGTLGSKTFKNYSRGKIMVVWLQGGHNLWKKI